MKQVSNWGKYPTINANIKSFATITQLHQILTDHKELIPRGAGRCYGDSSLNKVILSTKKFNRILYFDEKEGILTCESGVTLADILTVFIPKGWFLPVTPGTKHVTLGGAIASDVHGKNHHVAGSLSNHVMNISIMLPCQEIKSCSKQNNKELFWLTCGGMGLTGVILYSTLKLIPIETAYIRQECLVANNLDEMMEHFENSMSWTYSVAWIDSLAKGKDIGKGVLIRGEHAFPEELFPLSMADKLTVKKQKKLNVPFHLPNFTLNKITIKGFNVAYYYSNKKSKSSMISYDQFFYPLDHIDNWNRIYGSRGLMQYQFVLPKTASKKGLQAVLTKVANQGSGSFLTVLKLFGKQDGMISFPQEGYTLALDFPVSEVNLRLLDELDKLILEYGGHLYLTKDARMKEAMFKESYEQAYEFIRLKQKWDPYYQFQSVQSKRLGI